jgi:non-ribosomal peptide synthetase component F
VFEGNSLSYGAVQQRALGLAGKLQAAGVGPGVAVGVLLERSLELPIAVLAVFMAGGCYVPLDPSYPEQRLQGYLEDSGAALVVTSSILADLTGRLITGMEVEVGQQHTHTRCHCFHLQLQPGKHQYKTDSKLINQYV